MVRTLEGGPSSQNLAAVRWLLLNSCFEILIVKVNVVLATVMRAVSSQQHWALVTNVLQQDCFRSFTRNPLLCSFLLAA